MRHPLYLGNFLILCGITTIFNNPWVYGFSLLPFAFLYFFIARGDEIHMRSRFGANYQEYSDRVTRRFLPKLNKLGTALKSTRPFSWKRGVHKEFDSCCAWLAGLSGLVVYKAVLTHGWEDAWVRSATWLLLLGISASLVLVKTVLRKLSKERVRIPALASHPPRCNHKF